MEENVVALDRKSMKSPFCEPMRDIDGNVIMEGSKTITLGIIAMRALDATFPNETISTEDKMSRWELMIRIRDGGKVDPSELKIIKDRIGKAFSPSIVGTASSLISKV